MDILGYTLSSGRFFHDGETYKVIGAPRANNLGKASIPGAIQI